MAGAIFHLVVVQVKLDLHESGFRLPESARDCPEIRIGIWLVLKKAGVPRRDTHGSARGSRN
jgi:hypothetical protein